MEYHRQISPRDEAALERSENKKNTLQRASFHLWPCQTPPLLQSADNAANMIISWVGVAQGSRGIGGRED